MGWMMRPTRREAIRAGVLTAWGLGLGELLRARAGASQGEGSEPTARADACILVWLAGGPSHLDTFDPKPDAPGDVRGEFAAMETAVPGVRISEVFPGLARGLDRISLVRSVTSPEVDHDRAAHHMLTGYRPNPSLVYPSHGSVVSRVRGGEGKPAGLLPPYVAIPDAPLFSSSGYLTPAYDPFSTGGDPNLPTFRVRDLTPPDRLTLERLLRRKGMVKALDSFSREVTETSLVTSRDRFAEQAYELLTSNRALGAFKIQEEPAATRERYGRTTLGQSLLLARRLVERGVPFVTVNDRGPGQLGWDTHVQNFPAIRDTLAPPVDLGMTALLDDLESRGLLERTLVVMMGEFGRTPLINPQAGRDHHGRAHSVILAGGGVPRGLVLGKTDGKGDSPVERPVTPSELAATIYTLLGIDYRRQFLTPDQQPVRLVDRAEPVAELLG